MARELRAGNVPGSELISVTRAQRLLAGAEPDVTSLLYVMDSGTGDERQYFYLGRIDAIAMLVVGRYLNRGGSVPVWRSVESPSFSTRFGTLARRMSAGRLLVTSSAGQPLGDIAHQAMPAADVAAKEVVIRDSDRNRHEFIAEVFFNQHNLLVMVTEELIIVTEIGPRDSGDACA